MDATYTDAGGYFSAVGATLAEAAEWDRDGPPADEDDPTIPDRQPPTFRCTLCASGTCTWHGRDRAS